MDKKMIIIWILIIIIIGLCIWLSIEIKTEYLKSAYNWKIFGKL